MATLVFVMSVAVSSSSSMNSGFAPPVPTPPPTPIPPTPPPLPSYPPSPPHIIMMLVDDLGFNAMWNNPDHVSPHVDQLAKEEGVILNSSYVYKYCSPTRGSFLSGRYPFKLDATRCNIIPWTLLDGLNLNYTTIPQKLKTKGYRTHHVGKWHQGLFKKDYTPTSRGFDTSLGFLTGGENHYSQSTCCDDIPKGQYPGCSGPFDLWNGSSPIGSGDPRHNSYNGDTFANEAVRLIEEHSADRANPAGFFLYFALHNTHGPLQAPKEYTDLYPTVTYQTQLLLYGMVSAVDESTRRVSEALKAQGMWDNCVLVWLTDNGSPVNVGGSNDPLRGGKGSNWEGGTRVPGFVSGGLLPSHMRGQVLSGMVHISDFYTTFANLAGVSAVDPNGPTPIDGIDQWDYITGANTTAPRQSMVYEHRKFNNDVEFTGAVRQGKWKLIVNAEPQADWFGHFSPNQTYNASARDRTACSTTQPCLFDLEDDPTEHVDLASSQPAIVERLLSWFKQLEDEYHPPLFNPPMDIAGYCASNKKNNGWLAPWH